MGLRIKDKEFTEMAIDHLSRNLQLNNRLYNQNRIDHFEPNFAFEQERRIEVYRAYVRKYKPGVKKI